MIDNRLGRVGWTGRVVQIGKLLIPGTGAAVAVGCGRACYNRRCRVGCRRLNVVNDIGEDHVVENAEARADDGFVLSKESWAPRNTGARAPLAAVCLLFGIAAGAGGQREACWI